MESSILGCGEINRVLPASWGMSARPSEPKYAESHLPFAIKYALHGDRFDSPDRSCSRLVDEQGSSSARRHAAEPRPPQPEVYHLAAHMGRAHNILLVQLNQPTFEGLLSTTAKFLNVFSAAIHQNLPRPPPLDGLSGLVRRSGQLSRDDNVLLGYLRAFERRGPQNKQRYLVPKVPEIFCERSNKALWRRHFFLRHTSPLSVSEVARVVVSSYAGWAGNKHGVKQGRRQGTIEGKDMPLATIYSGRSSAWRTRGSCVAVCRVREPAASDGGWLSVSRSLSTPS